MRVLFITQYFPPETGAAPARAAHFVRALRREGHDVHVVTGFPNHPSGSFKEKPRLRREEEWEGCRVTRVWLYASPNKTAWVRLANHVSFAMSALLPCFGGPRPDVMLASSPPLFLGLTAWIASRMRRVPYVLDCRDDWPHAAVALGELEPGFVTRALGGMSRFIQSRAERVVAVTPGMRRHLEARGLEARRVDLITNGSDTDTFRAAPLANGRARGFTVLYAGTHGLIHGMDSILDAAERLNDRSDIRFLFVGDGVAKAGLQRRAGERNLRHVEFRDSVPPEDLVELIHGADVCLATTRAHPFCGETIPVKLFDYLACGRPVVAAVLGDAAEVVESSGGGVVVTPEDGPSLARTIVELASDRGRLDRLSKAGPPFVEDRYSRRALGQRLVDSLERAKRAGRGRDVKPAPYGLYGFAKRTVDLLGAAALLLLLSPILVLVGILIRLDSPGPALFRQRRSGRGASEFTVLKFRTMRTGTPDLASHLMGPGSDRVTPLGRLLRRTSLDELPQLWNVFKGDMSLVGPRPALHNQDDLIALRQAYDVDALRPGVTGWAQVNGRDAIELEDKVAYDRYYRENLSPWLDLKILLRTVVVLFSSRGVY